MRLLLTLLVLFLILNCGDCSKKVPPSKKKSLKGSGGLFKQDTVTPGKKHQNLSLNGERHGHWPSKSWRPTIEKRSGNTAGGRQKLPAIIPVHIMDHGQKPPGQDPETTTRIPYENGGKKKSILRKSSSESNTTDSVSVGLEKLTLKEVTVTHTEEGVMTPHFGKPILPKHKKSSSTSKEKSDFEKASEELQNILKSNKVETEEKSPSTVTVQQPPLVAHVKLIIQGTYDHMGLFDPELRLFRVSGQNISIFASYRGQGFPLYIPFSAEDVPITVDSTGLLICQGYFERPYDVLVLLMELPSIFHRNPGKAAARLRELNCYYYGAKYVRPLPLRPSNPKVIIN